MRTTKIIRSETMVEVKSGDTFDLPEVRANLYQAIYITKVDSAAGTALITSDVGIGDFKSWTLIGQGDFLVLVGLRDRWVVMGSTGETGKVESWAVDAVPPGFLWADGSALNRDEYPRLFDTIGETFGDGNGSTTFNIPDYRGVYLRATGTNGIYEQSNNTLFSGPAVAEFQLDQLEQHRHAIEVYRGLGEVIDPGFIRSNRRYVGKREAGSISSEVDGVAPRSGEETRPFSTGVLTCIKV